MQKLLRAIYVPHCLVCQKVVQDEFRLCSECWRGFEFLGDRVCDTCGIDIIGATLDKVNYCETCTHLERAWARGRSALKYSHVSARFMQALKYGGREDLFKPAALWMLPYARLLVKNDTVIVPVPLHWSRLLRRRYNQAAGLAVALAKLLDRPVACDALWRKRPTVAQKKMDFSTRFNNMKDAISYNPRTKYDVTKRSVLLIDDVMTSGATLNAAAIACKKAGVRDVSTLVLMRVTL